MQARIVFDVPIGKRFARDWGWDGAHGRATRNRNGWTRRPHVGIPSKIEQSCARDGVGT